MNILTIGGSGALGKSIVSKFSNVGRVINIDVVPNTIASSNILLDNVHNLQKDLPSIKNNLSQFKGGLDAIFCVAGGFNMSKISDPDFFEKYREMYFRNVTPALLAGHLAEDYLKKNGILMFTGADSIYKNPSPEIMSYALPKQMVHSLAYNLASSATDYRVLTILP